MWAERTGDSSWNYENLLPYFKKIEDYSGDFPSDQHGFGGPIPVTRPNYGPGLKTLYEAAESLGYTIADPNGPQRVGFSPADRSIRRGRRVSSFTGYIRPLLGLRSNLKIVTNARARRIIFEGNRAVGVIFNLNNTINGHVTEMIVRARKEIIVSSGTIESPTLLLKSGIGPKEVLQENRITPVKYLPVGENLHDQAAIRLQFLVNTNSPAEVFISARDLSPENFELYNATGEGPYSVQSGRYGQAFYASKNAVREGNGD